MDAEVAIWLGELIAKAVVELAYSPGLTIEVEQQPGQWLQVVPEESESDGSLAGFLLNFPYRGRSGNPLEAFSQAGLHAPPGTRVIGWEDGGYAQVHVRPDVPLVGLAHFVGEILEQIVEAADDAELAVQIEYGF